RAGTKAAAESVGIFVGIGVLSIGWQENRLRYLGIVTKGHFATARGGLNSSSEIKPVRAPPDDADSAALRLSDLLPCSYWMRADAESNEIEVFSSLPSSDSVSLSRSQMTQQLRMLVSTNNMCIFLRKAEPTIGAEVELGISKKR